MLSRLPWANCHNNPLEDDLTIQCSICTEANKFFMEMESDVYREWEDEDIYTVFSSTTEDNTPTMFKLITTRTNDPVFTQLAETVHKPGTQYDIDDGVILVRKGFIECALIKSVPVALEKGALFHSQILVSAGILEAGVCTKRWRGRSTGPIQPMM